MLKSTKAAAVPALALDHASYPGALAASLCAYARRDQSFRHSFKELVLANFRAAADARPAAWRDTAIIMPENRAAADARAAWLRANRALLAEEEKAGLFAWALGEEDPAPRQIVVGIVGLAIPGVTLGLISRRKKITLIVKKGAARLNAAAMAEKSVALSLDVVAQALAVSGGEAARLEPEIADWFFGDRGLRLFRAEAAEFARIGRELRAAGIIHSITEIGGEEAIIAVSPALNRHYQETAWRLENFGQA